MCLFCGPVTQTIVHSITAGVVAVSVAGTSCPAMIGPPDPSTSPDHVSAQLLASSPEADLTPYFTGQAASRVDYQAPAEAPQVLGISIVPAGSASPSESEPPSEPADDGAAAVDQLTFSTQNSPSLVSRLALVTPVSLPGDVDVSEITLDPSQTSDGVETSDEAAESDWDTIDWEDSDEGGASETLVDDVFTYLPEAQPVDMEDADQVGLDIVDGNDYAATPIIEVEDGFQTVGFTWPASQDSPQLGVRVRDADTGEWSDWIELHANTHLPDGGTYDYLRSVRSGTEPFFVGDADAVQVATFTDVDTAIPVDDVQLLVVSSELPTQVDANAQNLSLSPQAARSYSIQRTFRQHGVDVNVEQLSVTAPTVIRRNAWNAAAPTCAMNTATLSAAIVHHTAGSNVYQTQAQAMQQIRNDQAFHMNGNGWCDIGYNFLVDRFGNIYEGRHNSFNANVIGVHAGGFNTGTVGIAFLGNHQSTAVPQAAIHAMGSVVGWRLGLAGRDPNSTVQLTAGVNSRWTPGTLVTLPRVMTHMDVNFTACPGALAVNVMPQIRQRAAQIVSQGSAANPTSEAQRRADALTRALFADLLGRSPDAQGLANWTNLMMGGMSQTMLVRNITGSVEHMQRRVFQAYRDVLRRGPDPLWVNWITQIQLGRATVDDIQLHFFHSQEFFGQGGGTNAGFVRHMYRVMLNREATNAEVNHWVNVINTQGRRAAIDGVWFSREAAQQRVIDYFQLFLGRAPDPSGLATWTTVMMNDGAAAVREGIAGSQEYLNRAIARFGN